jgi:galactokinase/mevalonate kinase-like predicted kinase
VRISASAPTRIDLAGGTIDIWPLYLFHPGAQTLNAAISLRARAWIEPRPDDRVELLSEDTDRDVNLAFAVAGPAGPSLRRAWHPPDYPG